MSPVSPHHLSGRRVSSQRLGSALAPLGIGVFVFAAMCAMAAVALQPATLKGSLRAAWFLIKVRLGDAAASDYMLLGKTSSWIGEDALRDAVATGEPIIADTALKALYLHYPDSPEALACREFEEIRAGAPNSWDRGYFWRYDRRSASPPQRLDAAAEVDRWNDFLRRYPGFSGADDASLHLARAQRRLGQFEAAAITLQCGLSLGDQAWYSRKSLRAWLWRCLDHGCSEEALSRLASHPAFEPLQGLLEYTRAIHAARRGRFAEAALALAALEVRMASGEVVIDRDSLTCNSTYSMALSCDAAPGWPQAPQALFSRDVAHQRTAFSRIAQWQLAEASALAGGLSDLAWRLRVRQARLLASDRHALLNLLIHQCSDAVGSYYSTTIAYQGRGTEAQFVAHSARWSRSELVACDLVDAFLTAGASRSQQRTALALRAQALTRLSREWTAGHRNHLALDSGDSWKTRARQARQQLRQLDTDQPVASVAALGGISASGVPPRRAPSHSTPSIAATELAASYPETPR